MEIKARASFIIQSPRKLRLVTDALAGLEALKALGYLENLDQKAAGKIKEVLNQAIANAKNNFHLKEENLKIKTIEVSNGPIYKRFQPVSHGLAHPIAKRTSHLKIVLEGEENGTKS
jgi:large subunit ribosomal protein L22